MNLTGTVIQQTDRTIDKGTLAVNTTIQSITTINPLGTLTGTGTPLIGNTFNSGRVSPGNSIGALTLRRLCRGGGLLIIESILGTNNSPTDKLIITGNASGNTLVQVINLGGLGEGTRQLANCVDLYGNIYYQYGFDDNSRRIISGNIGVRVHW